MVLLKCLRSKQDILNVFMVLFLCGILFYSYTIVKVEAVDNQQSQELQKKIDEYTQKISELQDQKNTLSSQIRYMDTQIVLATLQIQKTEETIITTKAQITDISEKIDGLNESIDYLSTIISQKINEGYKSRSVSFFDFFLSSSHLSSVVNRIKYLKVAQDNDRRVAFQAQQAKLNFEDQKVIREQKQKQLEELTIKLNKQKVLLASQKKQKENLLIVTQNDESRYQQLLEDAEKQLAGFKSFVKTAGGGVVGTNGFGTGSDGWYYTQRDERWAYKTIGYSRENIIEVGCLLTDIAMIMKKYGTDWTPFTVASTPSYFFSNTAYMLKPSQFTWPNNLQYVNISISQIKDEINAGHPVIAGLYAGKYGTHYVVLKQVDGDDYIMHDPYYGPDKKFSEHYSKSSIFVAAVFK